MSNNHFDVIVVGTGGVGSSALYHLASRGLRVLGLDRFPPGHARGSSHGESRVIRKAYFERSDYVPLLHRAYENWWSLESELGRQLLHLTGLLEVGPPDSTLIQGVQAAALQHQLPLQQVDRSSFELRFPGFYLPGDSVALYEPDGGYLLVEPCVEAHCELAQKHGARLRHGESVLAWRELSKHVEVETDQGVYRADGLVLAAGAWSRDLLRDIGVNLRVLRKHMHWFATPNTSYRRDCGSPLFFYETQAGYYYGFPQLEGECIKVAEHKLFGQNEDWVADPLNVSRAIDPQEQARVRDFLRVHLPDTFSLATRHSVCMYTMSPDEHFIVDDHPESERVCFAAGLSGHGFKFASVLGEVLADLATHCTPSLPIDFLSCRRFG